MSLHCMVDLETLDNVASSKILSIGAVVFNSEGTFLSTFYRNINIDGQEDRSISHDTLLWWFKQSDAARSAFTAPTASKHPLLATLTAFNQVVSPHKNIKLWSNGANFDLPILAHAMRQKGIQPAWAFWDERCFRTMKAQYKQAVPEAKREGDYHNALDDAKHQAHHLIAIHRARAASGGIL